MIYPPKNFAASDLLFSGQPEPRSQNGSGEQGHEPPVHKGGESAHGVPQGSRDKTGGQQGDPRQRGVQAQHGAFQRRRGDLRDESPLNARGHGGKNAVDHEDQRHHGLTGAESKAEIDQREGEVASDQQLFPPDSVGKLPAGHRQN